MIYLVCIVRNQRDLENRKSVTVCEAHCRDYTVVCEHSDDCSCPTLDLCVKKCRKDPAMIEWQDEHVCAMRGTRIGELFENECFAICNGMDRIEN